MCGIAGAIGICLSNQAEQSMLATMKNRGPDQKGVWRSEDCTILHSRLSIVDLEGGKQPMEYIRGNEHYIISYNGELYNTPQLRKKLTKLGYHFLGHSDTEAVLLAYAEWKDRAVDHFIGIYAFAIWEAHNKRLYLARDRMGVKPLFYYHSRYTFLFASEIKTILATDHVRARVDERGISELILIGPGRTPGFGVFCDIFEVEAGHHGYFSDGKLLLRPYWILQDTEFTDSVADVLEKVRWLVTDSIKSQMVSDVPIGTFLSGGLDSSLITAICAKEYEKPLDTFSVDYVDNDLYFEPGKFQPESDRAYIGIMNDYCKTRHHDVVLTTDALVEHLEEATEARDLPGMADVDFSLLALCKQVSKHVKVALSGECADEIFGGYPWFRDRDVNLECGFPWAQNTAYRAGFLQMNEKRCKEYVMERFINSVKNTDLLPNNSAEDRNHKILMNLNIKWFMQTLLDRKDRMSMYCGLEVRVPFCDHRIAEYLYSVPIKIKDYNGREKGLLRKAMSGLLPESVLWRKKSPYPKTHHPQYTKIVEDRLRSLLNQGSILQVILRQDALRSLLCGDQLWPWYGQLMQRPQTIAYMLQLDHWFKRYHVDLV